jgi:hydrogenase nickel incorporation protein HypA/HybF
VSRLEVFTRDLVPNWNSGEVFLTEMHEQSTVMRIVGSILSAAEKLNAERVTEVHLVIGEFTLLNIEQVRFLYDVIVKGTIMENSELDIEVRKGTVECSHCKYSALVSDESNPDYVVQIVKLICPKCGNKLNITAGRECLVKNIKITSYKHGPS